MIRFVTRSRVSPGSRAGDSSRVGGRLASELGDAYADALHEHRRLLRAAFTANEGAEVDTQDDAFFVAFGRASDAVAAAARAQLALSGGPIRVRMGLHTGEPQLTDQGYVGLDVTRERG